MIKQNASSRSNSFFKLVPKKSTSPINTTKSTVLKKKSSKTKRSNTKYPANGRKIFIGGIGTELTCKDITTALNSFDIDIVNKIRIFRGKTFNFAPDVEVKDEGQYQKIVNLKYIEVGGYSIEIRPHAAKKKSKKRLSRRAYGAPISASHNMKIEEQKSRHAFSVERQNKIKLKLFQLKVKEAENLLERAHIESEIRACKNALLLEQTQNENFDGKSRSYGKVRTQNGRLDSTSRSYGKVRTRSRYSSSNQSVTSLTPSQQEYLKEFQKRNEEVERREVEKRYVVATLRRHSTRDAPAHRGSQSLSRMDVDKNISQQQQATPMTVLDNMDISQGDLDAYLPREEDLSDPPLVENMGSLGNVSLENILDSMSGEKMKHIPLNLLEEQEDEVVRMPASDSQIILLVKDNVDGEISVHDVRRMGNAMC